MQSCEVEESLKSALSKSYNLRNTRKPKRHNTVGSQTRGMHPVQPVEITGKSQGLCQMVALRERNTTTFILQAPCQGHPDFMALSF